MEWSYRSRTQPHSKYGAASGVIHLPKRLADDLWLWKQECPDSSPEAFIFANKFGGFRCSSNYRKRVLHTLAEDLGLPRLTFSNHSPFDRDPGTKKGDGEGCARPAAAFQGGYDNRRLHAGNSRRRAGDGRFHQPGIAEKGPQEEREKERK